MDPADEPAPLLPDGDYDAVVVDAGAGDAGATIELAISTGEFKGQVLALGSAEPLGDPVDLLGMPATLTVAFGVPSVRIDH